MSLFDSTLAGVCSLVTDGTHDTPKSVADGFPLVKAKEIAGGIINFDQCEKISETDHKKVISRSKPEFGDTLFAHIGASLGDAAFVNSIREFSIKNVALFKPNPNIVDPRYLYYYVISHHFQERIKAMRTGSAQPFLGLSQLRGFSVRLHRNLSVQRRIASILSAYDDLIENNTRRIAILEEMARRIYEEWFVHFRFPGHEQVKMVESELGLIPEGWSILPLQDIATVTMGLSPKGESYNTNGDGIPLINGPVEFGDRFTVCIKWTTSPTKLCSAGDLIICVRGSTTGKYVKSDGVYCLGRGVCAIKSTWQCFVDQMFIHQLPILLAQTGGSTFPSWTGPQLKHHPVLLPSIDLLSRFESLVQPMNATVLNYSRKNANLRATRDLLLPKLISGELDVSTLPEPEEVITA